MPHHRTANRLATEKSPYLLQHAHNPVDWYAWGPEAFAAARDGNRPIFLSIGYSTCHWCHVMERESFEDPAVAAFLNARFVSIKVDREERPDVDRIYMTFVQATTGGGGWPLNVFLTPSLQPFFGGTYFPPVARHGHPAFLDLLQHLHRLWSERHAELVGSAAMIRQRLAPLVQGPAPEHSPPGLDVLAQAATELKAGYDPVHGGFGTAPKFPRPAHPAFLLRWARRSGDAEALQMVRHTCDRMAAGGIYDQIGGGFARYAVDDRWLVPHFEKMLYDNAQLAQLYLDLFLVTGEPRHAGVVRGILDYVRRDMTHPAGGFYSAEDADSEGKEGRFYCWTEAELRELLPGEQFEAVRRSFGITPAGNFVDHSDPEPLPGQNVLHVAEPALSEQDQARVAAALPALLAARDRRVRPHRDDKVLSSWNGLMLGAFARAGRVLAAPVYLQTARRNLRFLQDHLWDRTSGTLHHRWRDGARDTVQLLDAYAFLLSGVLDLYEAALEPGDLEFAIHLAGGLLARFHDPEHGGFWQSADDSGALILKVKEDYDGAEPTGNSVAALGLLRLAHLTGRDDFRQAALGTLRLFARRLRQMPQAMPAMLSALDYSLDDGQRVVIAGSPGAAGVEGLLQAAHSVYGPRRVVLGNLPPADHFSPTLSDGGEARAYLCNGRTCGAPTSDPAALRALLLATQ